MYFLRFDDNDLQYHYVKLLSSNYYYYTSVILRIFLIFFGKIIVLKIYFHVKFSD